MFYIGRFAINNFYSKPSLYCRRFYFPAHGLAAAHGFVAAHGLEPPQEFIFSIFILLPPHGAHPPHPARAGKLAAEAATIAVTVAVLANVFSKLSIFDLYVIIFLLKKLNYSRIAYASPIFYYIQ
jgi:hypothetical protein